MDSFEFWLRRMESKLERITNRVKTREEASDLLEMTKVIPYMNNTVFSQIQACYTVTVTGCDSVSVIPLLP